MIELTRLNGAKFFLNVTHIETVESTPDTIVTLFNGRRHIVREEARDVAERVSGFYRTACMAAVVPRTAGEYEE